MAARGPPGVGVVQSHTSTSQRAKQRPRWRIQDGQVQFVNCDQETFAGFMVEREVPEPGPGDTNFQQLQEGRDVEIITLPENPMSFNKKSS